MPMTPEEREIRFDVARKIVDEIYTDYCKDNSKTREQAREFCNFVCSMNNFQQKLKLEILTQEPLT